MSGAHSRKEYIVVAIFLAVLTLLEVGITYVDVSRAVMISALIGLAVAKAAAVAFFYMHLKSETKYLRWVVGFPMVFPPLYTVVLVLEAFWQTALR